MLMGVLRQMDGSVHQSETKRHTERDEYDVKGGVLSDEHSRKLGVIELNTINEMEIWSAGG